MKHAYCTDELQLRWKMLFRLLLRIDFDHPMFPAGARIEDILPNPKGSAMPRSDDGCLRFIETYRHSGQHRPNVRSRL